MKSPRPYLLPLALAALLAGGCSGGDSGPSPLIRVNPNNFQSVVMESDKPVLVEFSSPSCGPCVAMEPHLAAVAREHGEQVVFAKVIVEESDSLTKKYAITAVPTLVVIKEGEVQTRREGYLEKSQLAALLRPYLSGE
jgi:thioredoxin 1